jgi:POT family proton-dependent oligopeptide transporter
MTAEAHAEQNTLMGHPTGLFTLFFAEMWERFSYYGMRALLVFYMIKGFLGYNDDDAYAVYGAYTALVYATPFIGGMLADRLLGARHAVVIGGLLMAGGHLLMTIENSTAFFTALALLIVGNGFFKPNISTIVGSLYPKDSLKKDGGFTIFYMGINLGAAMSPVICGYVGETYGWHYGFGLATAGMLVGVAVFVAHVRVTMVLILVGALATSIAMPLLPHTWVQLMLRIFLGLALTTSGIIAFMALGRGGLPNWAGAPPSLEALNRKVLGFLSAKAAVYLGILVSIPIMAFLVQRNQVAGWTLSAFGIVALGYLLKEAFRCDKIARERLYVVLILMFFSMLFWAFFEQAGSSVNNFTDRNIDRVLEERIVTETDLGQTLDLELTQEQLGYANRHPAFRAQLLEAVRLVELKKGKLSLKNMNTYVAEVDKLKVLTLTGLDALREAAKFNSETLEKLNANLKKEDGAGRAAIKALKARIGAASGAAFTVKWTIDKSNLGMGISAADGEIRASEFQAVNPIFILFFGLPFAAIWAFMGARGIEPSTPTKFALGMVQLGMGFLAFWYGAQLADDRGMVGMVWLLLGYLLWTTGELCLSPVGLSMVTKLSPTRLVSTVMGAWFLATAFSNYLAGMIAKLTGIAHGAGGAQVVPAPSETLPLYTDVFWNIGLTALGAGVVCLMLVPFLKRWMHEGEESAEA